MTTRIPESIRREAMSREFQVSIRIGKSGVTETLISEIDTQLKKRGIVKIKMNRGLFERDAISGVEIETFYGDIKFSDAGNNIAKPMFMRQINASGNYNLVETAKDMAFPRKVAY